jgi:hypothetical protein
MEEKEEEKGRRKNKWGRKKMKGRIIIIDKTALWSRSLP